MTGYGRSFNAPAALVAAGLTLGLWAGPAAAQVVADDVVCSRCVDTSDIESQAITTGKLANDAVSKNKIQNGAVKSRHIGPNQVTGGKILDGTVGLADLSPAVQQVIADLQAKVAAIEALLAVVSVEDVPTDLNNDGFIDESPVDLDGDGTPDAASEFLPTVIFEGVNLQVVNGHPSEATQSLNALGNLIVGYNESRTTDAGSLCSEGGFADNAPVTGCQANGHFWSANHKSGSHNLVVGAQNAYSRAGGVAFGERGMINGPSATVTGGRLNTASSPYASVTGGAGNTASGSQSSVTGGVANTASGGGTSISGGTSNTASGDHSSVSGGFTNTASGSRSSVSGGSYNRASGPRSSVSGGAYNRASGENSSVSGGYNGTISSQCDWGGEGSVFGDGAC